MKNRPLIFSTHSLHPDIAGQLGEIGTLKIASEPTRTAIENESNGAQYIVVRANIPAEVVQRENGLRALVRHGAGLDMIPVDLCTQAGVLVANVPGANALTVAEHVIWTSLAIMRHYPIVNKDMRRNGWEAGRAHSNAGMELSGKTIGIVGMGNIGRTIARMTASAFNCRIITATRSTSNLPDNVEPVSIADLLMRADVIVLSCPLTDETRGLIDANAFLIMKHGAILINVSRGPVINETALLDTLKSGKLCGVALDVFNEQPLAADHPLFQFDNVILTPHMAGITTESMLRMGQGVVDEISRINAGGPPLNFINPEALSRYNKRFL